MKKLFLLFATPFVMLSCKQKPFEFKGEGILTESASQGEEKLLSTSVTYYGSTIEVAHGKNDPAVNAGAKFKMNEICPSSKGYTCTNWSLASK